MLRKKLIIFYNLGPGNKEIAKSDFEKFYKPLKERIDPNKDLTCDYALCPDANAIVDKLEELVAPDAKLDELYLHFSGHGAKDGIPYQDWMLLNKDFVSSLRHPKVKFCFFSSCQAAELVKLASGADIPVVIGTSDNNIENDYAIHFQKTFYTRLSESFTYKVSFEKGVADANRECKRNADSNVIIRGEGGGDFSDEAEINELQLILKVPAGEDEYLIPPNWVMKMNEAGYDKTWCLNWFDDLTLRDNFYRRLENEGLGEVLRWEELPTDELYLLMERGDDDPFKNGEVNLILHCSKKELLPENLRLHLQKGESIKATHFNTIFCFKEDLDTDTLLGDKVVLNKYPKSHTFEFENYSADLIGSDEFRKALDRNEISASERRKIVMDFDTKPIKDEFLAVENDKLFIRIFFAQNANERLINFIANWAKATIMPNSPPFIADNRHNAELDLIADLEQQLQLHNSNTKSIYHQFYSLYDTGAIIILRNWSDDPNTSIAIMKRLVAELDKASTFYGEETPKLPTLFFVLHEGLFDESLTKGNRIWLKRFTKPYVNKAMIDEWAAHYSPKYASPAEIVRKVKEISAKINPDDFKEKCPSKVLEFICMELKLPQTVVFKI